MDKRTRAKKDKAHFLTIMGLQKKDRLMIVYVLQSFFLGEHIIKIF